MQTAAGHIGYKVKNLEESIESFCTLLGGQIDVITTVPETGSKVAFVRVGDLLVELIEPVDKAALESATGPVFDHAAIGVDDLEGMVASLRAKGVACNPQFPRASVVGERTTFIVLPELGGRIQLMGR